MTVVLQASHLRPGAQPGGFRLQYRALACYTPTMREKMSFSKGSRLSRSSNENNVSSLNTDRPWNDQHSGSHNDQGMPELEDVRSALETALAGLAARQETISVSEAIGAYMDAGRPRWKASSLRKMELRAREICEFYGGLRLGELTRPFGSRVLSDAPSASAKRERLELLGAAWRLAMEDGKIFRPVPWGKLAGPKARARERYLSAAELDRFWAALERLEPFTNHPGSLVAVRLLVLTGCRVDEICTLRASDIDWTQGLLRLRDSKVGAREVPIGSRVLALLHALKPSGWVCKRDDGKPVTQHRVRVDLASVCKLAKIPRVTCHVLRHTWATHALLAGVPVEHVRIALGHSTQYMTAKYGHLTAREVRASIDKATEAVRR